MPIDENFVSLPAARRTPQAALRHNSSFKEMQDFRRLFGPDEDGHRFTCTACAGFATELTALRLASDAEGGGAAWGGAGAPVAFCCAGGAGRSGTALAADLLLHILDNNQVGRAKTSTEN